MQKNRTLCVISAIPLHKIKPWHTVSGRPTRQKLAFSGERKFVVERKIATVPPENDTKHIIFTIVTIQTEGSSGRNTFPEIGCAFIQCTSAHQNSLTVTRR